jgi:tetratricopeptide (TPR) repeat protein
MSMQASSSEERLLPNGETFLLIAVRSAYDRCLANVWVSDWAKKDYDYQHDHREGVSMMHRHLFAMLLALTFAIPTAIASGGGGVSRSSASPARDTDYETAVQAIKAREFPRAIELLGNYVRRNPNDADAWNWLGYANRKTGNLQKAFDAYDKALAINPKHLGAHEYLGEAYLMANNLPKAEEQLKLLGDLCWVPCEELADLKSTIAEYKKSNHAAK